MTICGIAAEWNPFHNGHATLINSIRNYDKTAIIIVAMSGPFTQRGEPALFDKWARAEMSIAGGADLVFELHQYWATGSLATFAAGSMATLSAAGPLDMLAFGSECGDVSRLKDIAAEIKSPSLSFQQRLSEYLSNSMPFGQAQQFALADTLGEHNLHQRPNDRLAAQYLAHLPDNIKPFAVMRHTPHDSAQAGIGIRHALRNGKSVTNRLPIDSNAIINRELSKGWNYPNEELLFPALQVLLLQHDASSLNKLLSYQDGTEHRYFDALHTASSLKDFIEIVQNRHHHQSSLRRDILQLLSPISPLSDPPYLRLLAASERGRQHIKTLRNASVPIVQNVGRNARRLNLSAKKHLLDDIRRQDLSAFMQNNLPYSQFGRDYKEYPRLL